ncbi:MAG: metallophosphoesterase [Calditrichia bacterium]
MSLWLFVSDLHGNEHKYNAIKQYIRNTRDKISAVFIAGDILPLVFRGRRNLDHFFSDFFEPWLENIKNNSTAVDIFTILGNDDPRMYENHIYDLEDKGLLTYVHNRLISWRGYRIFGYNFVPPTPFMMKDWEKYDVSRYVDPGCIHPIPEYTNEKTYKNGKLNTIRNDLNRMLADVSGENLICLFHSPPYNTPLDMIRVKGKTIDHIDPDPHVGSIAIREFIEEKQPFLTCHGHIHESASISGEYQCKIGRTVCLNTAHSGRETSIIVYKEESGEFTRYLV